MDPLNLTRELVAIESPTGAEGRVTAFMAEVLAQMGYRVSRQQVSADRQNLYGYREPPELVFSTHLDCVPPYVPFREDGERLYGRGSCDAKGIAAAMVAAAERLSHYGQRRIGLLFLVGEENGSDGARAAESLEPKGRYLINGEPTENQLCIGQKGSLRADLLAVGRAAHSAYPDEGVSAIAALLDTLERIRRLTLPIDPLLGPSTVNLGLIQGGVAPNVIAPEARAQLLFRTVGPTSPLKQAVASTLAPGVSVSFPVELPSHKASAPAPAGWDTTIVSFASDLPFLTSWGVGYQLGPGSIKLAHTDGEYVGKTELLDGVDRYVRLAQDLLTVGGGP